MNPSQGNVSLTQSSLGGLSDIIQNVEDFIEENDMKHDMTILENPISASNLSDVIGHDCPPKGEPLVGPNGDFYYHDPDIDDEIEEEEEDIYNHNGTQYIQPPEQTRGNLTTVEYEGIYNFNVSISSDGKKQPWEYSSKLNKIFINWRVDFPIFFSIKNRPMNNRKLFIRATPVFTQAQYFEELVYRCVGHEHSGDSSNIDVAPHVVQHVLRSTNSQAIYHGKKERGLRLNIVLPLAEPQPGSEAVREFFNFQCKSSCASGMDRRPIDIIFTLEDIEGEILGRKTLSFRICSSPKRDKAKEEEEEVAALTKGKKRKRPQNEEPEQQDTNVYSLHHVTIVGKENRKQVLEYCFNLMAGQAALSETNSGNPEPYRQCMYKLQKSLRNA